MQDEDSYPAISELSMEVYALEGQTIPQKCEETKARHTVDPETGFRYNEGHELSL